MERMFKAIIGIVLLLVMVSLTAVLVLVCTMPDRLDRAEQICLPQAEGALSCGSIQGYLPEYLQRTIAKKYEETKTRAKEQQQLFLDKNKARLTSILDPSFWDMKPAAQLTGIELSKTRKSDEGSDMIPIREWRNGRALNDASAFERRGIRYRNGRFVVPVHGTYFIYSYVSLFEPCDSMTGTPNVKDLNKPIRHGIYKFNSFEEEETEIVSNVQPHVIPSNKYFNAYGSYVSSLAELKAGDEISVKVSNITYLKYPRDNNFGIFLVF